MKAVITKGFGNFAVLKKLLLIDNFDSFTFNLYHYVQVLGCSCEVLRNNDSQIFERAEEADAIIISPGPGVPEEAGLVMSVLRQFYRSKKILGVCLGHQAIGEFFGAALERMPAPLHGKVRKLYHSGQGIFEGLPPEVDVCHYHSLVLRNVKNPLIVEARGGDSDEVMAIRHKDLPVTGIQFHPESILTSQGLKMMANWLK